MSVFRDIQTTRDNNLCWCYDSDGQLITDSPTLIKFNTCGVHQNKETVFARWLEEAADEMHYANLNKPAAHDPDCWCYADKWKDNITTETKLFFNDVDEQKRSLYDYDAQDYEDLKDKLNDVLDCLEDILRDNGRY